MFGAPATAELDPLVGLDDATKPLRSKLLAVPALKERYLSYVREIAQKHMDWKTLGPRVQQYQALIAEDVKADTRKLYIVRGVQERNRRRGAQPQELHREAKGVSTEVAAGYQLPA